MRAGAKLSDADKTKLKAMNAELAILETTFNQDVLKEKNADSVIVTDRAELAGMSDARNRRDRKPPPRPTSRTASSSSACSTPPPSPRSPTSQNRGLAPAHHGGVAHAQQPRRQVRRYRHRRAHRQAARRTRRAARLSQPRRLPVRRTDHRQRRARSTSCSPIPPRPPSPTRRRKAPISRRSSTRKRAVSNSRRGTGICIPRRSARQRYAFDESQIKPYFELNHVLHRRRVFRGDEVLRDHVQGTARPAGLPAGRAGVRGVRTPTARRSRCSSSTTTRGRPSAAARG